MIHAFPRTFVPAAPAARSRVTALPPLTPAAYLRLRRIAAGYREADDVARAIVRTAQDLPVARSLVRNLETPGIVARQSETLARLRAAFAFDPDVYRQIATEPPGRHPLVCRICGASAWDDANACDACTRPGSGGAGR